MSFAVDELAVKNELPKFCRGHSGDNILSTWSSRIAFTKLAICAWLRTSLLVRRSCHLILNIYGSLASRKRATFVRLFPCRVQAKLRTSCAHLEGNRLSAEFRTFSSLNDVYPAMLQWDLSHWLALYLRQIKL